MTVTIRLIDPSSGLAADVWVALGSVAIAEEPIRAIDRWARYFSEMAAAGEITEEEASQALQALWQVVREREGR